MPTSKLCTFRDFVMAKRGSCMRLFPHLFKLIGLRTIQVLQHQILWKETHWVCWLVQTVREQTLGKFAKFEIKGQYLGQWRPTKWSHGVELHGYMWLLYGPRSGPILLRECVTSLLTVSTSRQCGIELHTVERQHREEEWISVSAGWATSAHAHCICRLQTESSYEAKQSPK